MNRLEETALSILGAAAVEAGSAFAKSLMAGKSDEEILAEAQATLVSYRNAERVADAAAKAKFPRLR